MAALIDAGILNQSSLLGTFTASRVGAVMSELYLSFESVRCIQTIENTCTSMIDVLSALSRLQGVQQPLRRSEKATLINLNDHMIRYRVKVCGSTSQVVSEEMKVNILLQAAIGRALICDEQLVQETNLVADEALRFLTGVIFLLV